MDQVIRIGTRGNPLALAQAAEVQRRLAVAVPALAAPDAIKIVPIRTTGDRNLELALSEIGGKGLFTKELEVGLLADTLDIAVHSMKDMPTALPSRRVIAAQFPREPPARVIEPAALSRYGPRSFPALRCRMVARFTKIGARVAAARPSKSALPQQRPCDLGWIPGSLPSQVRPAQIPRWRSWLTPFRASPCYSELGVAPS
jgi:hydroxymethylbilane synthase